MVAVVETRPTAGHAARPRRAGPAAEPAAPSARRAVVCELTYRRRRAAATAVVVAMFLAVQGLLATVAGSGGERPPAPVPAQGFSAYVVQPGDTFWSIARRLEPDGDPRPLVDRLVAEHGSAVLEVGERIALPERR